MKKFQVDGTSNSVLLNKNKGYFAVSYYDNNIVSIYNYLTGNLLKELKTFYCSASSNILVGNDKYFCYLVSAKEVIVADADSFETLHTLKLSHCGAVNSLSLKGDKLLVGANKAIGNNADYYQNIFLFDLEKRSSSALTDGKHYVKKAILLSNSIVAFCNRSVDFSYLDIFLENHIYREEIIDTGNVEYFNLLPSDKDLYVVAKVIDNDIIKHNVYLYNENNNKITDVKNSFDNIDIHTGYVRENGNSYLVVFDKNIAKYTLLVTNGFDGRVGNTVLGVSVVTESVAVDDTYFCFGADKSIYFVEV